MKVNEEMYYIRNEGFLGNALIWWTENSNGYTCDIQKAGKYKLEDAWVMKLIHNHIEP